MSGWAPLMWRKARVIIPYWASVHEEETVRRTRLQAIPDRAWDCLAVALVLTSYTM